MTIPVICDRCRVAGTAGTGDFSQFGDLLEFDPVPRRPRVNGWNAEAQRAFIALLATTGSKRRAAMAIGRNAFGVDQLLAAPGNDGFKLAYGRALAIAERNGSIRIATGVADAAARNALMPPLPSRLQNLPSREREGLSSPSPSMGEGWGEGEGENNLPPNTPENIAERFSWIERLVSKYLVKLRQEREARMAGQIAAADFYVRQITYLEVLIDLGSDDAFMAFKEARHHGRQLVEIAETFMSQLLDEARRDHWREMGEPVGPAHPPRHLLLDQGDIRTEPLEHTTGGGPLSREEQLARYEQQYAEDAKAQVEWEAAARSHAGVHDEI